MTKRSAGITLWAIIFITLSAMQLLGASVVFLQRPRVEQHIEQMLIEIQEQQEGELRRAEARRASPTQVARMRKRFEDQLYVMREFNRRMSELGDSPIGQFHTVVPNVLAVATCLAGVGILQLREWARVMVIGLSIPTVVAELWLFTWFGANFSHAASTLFSDSRVQELARQWLRIIVVLLVVLSIAWRGFIIWFFRRSSVKAQFVRAG